MEEERREERREEEERNLKITFWNVAGLTNKDEEFWKRLGGWDVMVLMETWVERKGWERVKNKLPKGYRWGVQWATRSGRRGRAKGE